MAQLTRQDKYYDAIARVTNELEKLQDLTEIPGLWPLYINAQGCAQYKPDRGVAPSVQGERARDDTSANKPPTNTTAQRSLATPTDLESYLKLASRDTPIDVMGAEPARYGRSKTPSYTEGETEECTSGLLLPDSAHGNRFTLGAKADSTYEYLPKEHLLLGGVTDQYRNMYKKAIDAARNSLLFRPMMKGGRDIRFMASTGSNPSKLEYDGSHLICFVGGMVAIGAKTFGIEGDMDLAYKLTDGCVWAYEATNTGIMPERFHVLPCTKDRPCEWDDARYDEQMKPFDHPGDLGGVPSRTSASVYEQRVQLNTNSDKPQVFGENGKNVPLPMPGSLNPHDSDLVYKRDAVGTGQDGAARASVVPSPSPLGKAPEHENLANRDAPARLPRPAALQPERNNRPPIGMTRVDSPEYLLRPEAIESVFIMFRLTGDDYWRRKGWKMFEAISKYTRTELANAVIKDVTSEKPVQKDSMESFWLAETLKYFYLLFCDPSVVDLDKYVL